MNEKLKIVALRKCLENLQILTIQNDIEPIILTRYDFICNYNTRKQSKSSKKSLLIAITVVLICVLTSDYIIDSFLSTRCLVSSNYLVWEATRPLANCDYCKNVTKPLILRNITRQDFVQYAYSSQPIIVKSVIGHWKATKYFNYDMFKRLYENTDGSYESLEEGCQFLNFKTNLYSLKDVFNMPEERARNDPGQEPWYIGWGNCHPDILTKVRKFYDIPYFLPKDAEFSATENIFFGYEMGAVMHLDYIPRLMWQGQVKGMKYWTVAPVPECEYVCDKFGFYVEPHDVVLLDTRIWYHATRIPKGQFSLTVQSEYG